MRVLVLGTFLSRRFAGSAHGTVTILNALSARHEVHAYAWEAEPGLVPPGIPLIMGKQPRPRRFIWRWPSLTLLSDVTRELGQAALPAVDLCYTRHTALGLAYRRLYPGTPIITHTGAVLPDREYAEESGRPSLETWLERRLLNRLEQKAYAEGNWTHFVSTRLVAGVRERHYRLPAGFFRVEPLPVDPDRFPGPGGPTSVRAELAIPENVPLIACVGRLVPLKQVDLLLHAVAASPSAPWLIVAGEGSEGPRLQQLAHDLGIAGRCRFVGQVAPAPVLAASDFFVLPSRLESFGLAYAEAMTMGLPCVGLSNRWPGVLSAAEEIIPEGKVGFCAGSPQELQVAVDRLSGEVELRRRMRAAAGAWAARQFGADRYCAALEAAAGRTAETSGAR